MNAVDLALEVFAAAAEQRIGGDGRFVEVAGEADVGHDAGPGGFLVVGFFLGQLVVCSDIRNKPARAREKSKRCNMIRFLRKSLSTTKR